jgi:uncharacterized SAM-dependent methyltransferase
MNDALISPLTDLSATRAGFLSEAVSGLSRPQKWLPCKFLYDAEGSRLFNEICQLEEYYPTRTENQILRDHIHEIAGWIGAVHLDSQEFSFDQGEYITTEYSYKYALPGFAGLALRAGFELIKSWEDRNHLFSVLFLQVKQRPTEFERDFGEFAWSS